ncbi:unnamed protein product [Aureobasidium vineae]|uniref:Uncharacterized protein n=1 Tax=Aureobasidium vineae TaxID=2773715 RepID=A0A9N8JCP1_9PEZI|nr:unnamed protein product [Aureobasidium vineae]
MESRATELPSLWAVAFGASVVAGLAGYFLGTASSIGVFGSNPSSASSAAPVLSLERNTTPAKMSTTMHPNPILRTPKMIRRSMASRIRPRSASSFS